MYILNLLSSPLDAIVFLLGLVLAVTVHECAHAWTAWRLGDDTPYLDGRVTLNPGAHLDPVGSLLFLIAGIGWGRPVIYNPMRLSRRVDELWIALAGPASNLALALGLNLLAYLAGGLLPGYGTILMNVAYVNVALAAFNVIPIPPLDGSSVVAYFWPEYRSVIGGQLGILVLLVLLFLPVGGGSLIEAIIGPVSALFSWITTVFGIL